jgi:hypothetical protein
MHSSDELMLPATKARLDMLHIAHAVRFGSGGTVPVGFRLPIDQRGETLFDIAHCDIKTRDAAVDAKHPSHSLNMAPSWRQRK